MNLHKLNIKHKVCDWFAEIYTSMKSSGFNRRSLHIDKSHINILYNSNIDINVLQML